MEDFGADPSRNGVQVQNSQPDIKQIKKVAFAVDACQETIDKAVAENAELSKKDAEKALENAQDAAEELKKVNPDIILYGEGWTGADSVLAFEERAMKVNAPQMMEFGMFSDDIRDAVKGHVFELDRLGFANGADNMEEKIREVVVGCEWAKEPYQSINYLSCHDNNTLWDRLHVSGPDKTDEEILRMNKLAASILFTAQGIPFFLMGEVVECDATSKIFHMPNDKRTEAYISGRFG